MTAQRLRQRVKKAAAAGDFSEDLLQECVCHVLDENGVPYETEHPIGQSDAGNARFCDIYIPATDSAIELKLSANLRGIGQCVYYSRYCREAILLSDGDPVSAGHNSAVMRAAEVSTGVKYGLCIPKLAEQPTGLEILSNSKAEFFFQASYGQVGDRDFAHIKPLGEPSDYSGPGVAVEESPVNHRVGHSTEESGEVVRNE